MKTNKRIIPALVVSLFATLGAAQSQAAQFSNVYVFGDSLSDAGYFRPFLTSLRRTCFPVELFLKHQIGKSQFVALRR